jgi:hypothetical protein
VLEHVTGECRVADDVTLATHSSRRCCESRHSKHLPSPRFPTTARWFWTSDCSVFVAPEPLKLSNEPMTGRCSPPSWTRAAWKGLMN